MLKLIHKGALLVFLMMTHSGFLCNKALAQNAPSLEYQIKASLIYNFLKFIEWPQDSKELSNQTLHICTLGEERYGRALGILDNETVNSLQIKVDRLSGLEESSLDNCMVVVINESLAGAVPTIMRVLKNHSVLTIGETDGFLENGGIINFIVQGKKIRFEINNEAAAKARLVISSKLLRLASNVKM